jgi:hypothetical protein
MESVGKPKAGFPRFPPPLGNLATPARFPHSQQPWRQRAWESGKPKPGFPLSHNALREYDYGFAITKSRREEDLQKQSISQREFSGSSTIGNRCRFQAHVVLE